MKGRERRGPLGTNKARGTDLGRSSKLKRVEERPSNILVHLKPMKVTYLEKKGLCRYN